jgi:hypothetical protein
MMVAEFALAFPYVECYSGDIIVDPCLQKEIVECLHLVYLLSKKSFPGWRA